MTAAVTKYLLAVAAAGMLVSLMLPLLPEGSPRRVGNFVGSLLVILAVLSPLRSLDPSDMAEAIARIRTEGREAVTGVEVGSRELLAAIIKEDCEAYIWDKAREMGLELEVVVTVDEGTGYPYPTGAVLTGAVTAAQQEILSRWMEENLGIAREEQEWRTM